MGTHETATEVIEKRNVGLTYEREQIPIYFNIISDLTSSINQLRHEVQEMKETHAKEHKVIYVKEIPLEEAKELVLNIIKENKDKGIETLDIAEKACLSMDIVFEIIKRLEEDGKIAKVD